MKMPIAAVAFILLSGCHSLSTEVPRASAQLQPTQGNKTSGEANFAQAGDKVRVSVDVRGLKPGAEHGMHIHEVGDCSSRDGMSTKGHFDPLHKPHGRYDSPERHAGDLPALKAGADGSARMDADVSGISLAPGATNIIGRALIIHADPDDYKTQPTGNSGARIACGVIRAR